MILLKKWFKDPDNEDLVYEICEGIQSDDLVMDEPDPVEVAVKKLRDIGEAKIADMIEAGEISFNN